MARTYEFELILAGHREMTPEMTEALFEAGCDDSTPGSSKGEAFVAFSRRAETFEEAIRSAIADARKAGLRVAEIRLDDHAIARLAADSGNGAASPSDQVAARK